MINIEIYQLSHDEGIATKNAIVEALKETHLLPELKTTIINAELEARSHNLLIPKPHIRICSDNVVALKRITDALKRINFKMDTETLLLSGFIPTEQMVEDPIG